jgi:hypothetical protein
MAGNRADPFASIDLDASDFEPTPVKHPAVPKAEIRRVSEENQFVSRASARAPVEAAAAKTVRQQRHYRTGRNVQFAAKVTQDTYDHAYRLLDQLGPRAVLGELLEQAFGALERELKASARK